MRNVSVKTRRENQNTHLMINNFCSFWKSYRWWGNVEKYGTAGQTTDDNTVRRMRLACWINKATDKQSGYVTVIAFPVNNGNANAPQYYVILHCCSCSLLLWVALNVLQDFLLPSARTNQKTTLWFKKCIDHLNRKLLFLYSFAFISNRGDYIYHFKWHEQGAPEEKFGMLN
jgi:hypothetical protein